uniref:Uncharacterized protein n=1 Tax=Klebsiella pneumoniae TaxID=573 RepID=A0A2R4NDA8_KLEPN|nr:Hypothetical protein [Klebsiella pneumoniae]
MQLHQQKGMISLSPPTICNSALRVSGRRAAGYGGHRTVTASAPLSCTIHK